MASWKVSRSAASKPGRTCCSDRKLRTSRPAPISRITDSETSPRISALRTRCRAALVPARPPAWSDAVRILSGGLERRRQPEGQRRHQAGERGERQHSPVHVDLAQTGEIGRVQHAQEAQRQRGHHEAERPAGQREQPALGQELPDHRPAARAQRGAERELALPDRRPHQQQVGDVGAGDHQHETDRAEQDQQRGPGMLDDVLLQRHGPDAHLRAGMLRELLAELQRDAVHLRLCLGEGHARLEPAEHREERVVPRRRLAVVELQRRPHLGVRDQERLGRAARGGSRAEGRRRPCAPPRRAGSSTRRSAGPPRSGSARDGRSASRRGGPAALLLRAGSSGRTAA